MNKSLRPLIFIFSLINLAFSQEVQVIFIPKFGNEILVQGKKYFSQANRDSLSIETFRFYVSKISLMKNGKEVYTEKKSFHLIDLEKNLRFTLKLKKTNFDAIKFCVGIDSVTNVSGVMGGDLDPVNGMYWAWQSGYINFKLEGISKVCPTRNNVFQFHIGGYLPPNQSIRTVSLPANDANKISIHVDLEKFINGIDLKTTNEIMSPSEKAVSLAKLYQTIFTTSE
ncbi:MAG: MbnP family protein [Bacteroidia bacterium]